jgi:hypothetical protein
MAAVRVLLRIAREALRGPGCPADLDAAPRFAGACGYPFRAVGFSAKFDWQ